MSSKPCTLLLVTLLLLTLCFEAVYSYIHRPVSNNYDAVGGLRGLRREKKFASTTTVSVLSRGTATMALYGKITPRDNESMDEYRKAVVKVLEKTKNNNGALGGREILELLVKKWGVGINFVFFTFFPINLVVPILNL